MAEPGAQSLAGVDLLEDLGEDDLARIEKMCAWKRYGRNEEIIDRSSDSRDVFFIVEGRVRVVNYSLTGREVTLDDLESGSYFGELAAIDGQPRSAMVVALTDTLAASLAPARFMEMLREYPDVAQRVLMRLTRIIRVSTDRIMDLSTLGANNRVHAELLRLGELEDDDDNVSVITPIPVHSDIASRVSTTRETVARVMNSLSRQGILEREKDRLVIRDIDRLMAMVEEVRGE
ncbi:MAG: Crp/Fnr family transcriptional regulator [Rhodospirillales bacterium]|nr:Crp/Fnr family transcriptional regulator [Rhodospirillales bacterium]MCW8861617.1 Crp/Fnr family transcriptional regulator [Rhodospirillales bacterium]MCW8951506.1 Crp/Fnr family transcriptional regulator [Rhodospirillales bacterium]MCW8970593.1 Crp/Fnr family transcriptional regulator [Rhodospirillales bacterium]MCW9001287.1 Crp/Fnr family transcriptional regulator [Rhodospirillales bacterium]